MPLTWKTFSALSMYVLELLDSGTNATMLTSFL